LFHKNLLSSIIFKSTSIQRNLTKVGNQSQLNIPVDGFNIKCDACIFPENINITLYIFVTKTKHHINFWAFFIFLLTPGRSMLILWSFSIKNNNNKQTAFFEVILLILRLILIIEKYMQIKQGLIKMNLKALLMARKDFNLMPKYHDLWIVKTSIIKFTQWHPDFILQAVLLKLSTAILKF